jgi:GNAT superfamily N-acetyltransferase
MAIGAFVRESKRERLVGIARYYANSSDGLAEAAFTVHDRYQGKGIGSFLIEYLIWIAQSRGLKGFSSDILPINRKMKRVLERTFKKLEVRNGRIKSTLTGLFVHRRNRGNPVEEERKTAA